MNTSQQIRRTLTTGENMTAPLVPSMNTIKISKELLSREAIEQPENSAHRSPCQVTSDFGQITYGLNELKDKLKTSTALFDRITAISRQNADKLFEASRILRLSAERINQAAQKRQQKNKAV